MLLLTEVLQSVLAKENGGDCTQFMRYLINQAFADDSEERVRYLAGLTRRRF